LLFAFGLLEWIAALVVILLYQLYGAPRVVGWRVHRRAITAALNSPQNFQILWNLGGIAIALKDWPEKSCVGPKGDWRVFCAEFLIVPETVER
jgi:hypothetical protein